MVTDPADEEGETTGGLVVERGHDLLDVERGLAERCQAHDFGAGHVPTLGETGSLEP